eukprot:UN21301
MMKHSNNIKHLKFITIHHHYSVSVSLSKINANLSQLVRMLIADFIYPRKLFESPVKKLKQPSTNIPPRME